MTLVPGGKPCYCGQRGCVDPYLSALNLTGMTDGNLGCILSTPNAPGERVFLRCAAPFFLEIRQYSREKMSCSAQKFLAAGHIWSFQIHTKL